MMQLRAAVEILASQTPDRRGEPDVNAPIFEKIGTIENRAAEMPMETSADIGAALDVLREMIDPQWQYADLRDARLFDAIRDGVGVLMKAMK
jgi:hypothetical protein